MTLGELGHRLKAIARRRRLKSDLQEEITGHLEELQREYEQQGFASDEARRRAMLRLGGVLATRESSSDVWRFAWIEDWIRDLRLGARNLGRQPAFSLAVVATFALGIGAATAIFSVAYGIAFRPLPYPRADRLVRIYEANTATNEPKLQVSQGTFQGWRESVRSLEDLALFSAASVRYTSSDSPQPLALMTVSPRFFDVLRVAPIRGRTFKDESEYGRGKTVELVIAYDAWRRVFGGDENVVGQPIHLNNDDDPITIVGIMPRGFIFDAAVDAWQPEYVELPVARVIRSWRYDRVIARLRPDRTIEQLRAELDAASARLAREFPDTNAGWTTTVEPLHDAIIGRFRRASWLLLAAVAAVLLVACANVAGLLTARALGRTRETSIRMALGAGRWPLVRLWLSEAFVLAATGACVGVTTAWWLVRLLRATAPPGLPRVEDIALDLPTLVVACVATIFSAVVCAVIPIFSTCTGELSDGLSAGTARAGDTPVRRHVSTGLVALQCGAALALVVLSIVFVRSFLNLTSVDLGWRPERVLSLQVSPRLAAENRRPWFLYTQWAQGLTARLEATPGIARAAVTTGVPFSPDTYPAEIARGRRAIPEETRWPVALHVVTEGYFDTLGLTLRHGRRFTTDDRFDEPTLTGRVTAGGGVAIISESAARALWPGEDAIGQQFRVPGNDRATFREVVGVVADVQFTVVGGEPVLNIFLPWMQNPAPGLLRLVVRATGDAAAIAPVVRQAVLAHYAATAIDRVTLVETLVERAMLPARFTSQLVTGLGVLALLLAGVGVYGSLSMLVTARARGIAVRMVLGASPSQTLWRTLGQGLWPVILGAAVGVTIAVLVVASARSLLFGIDRLDFGSLVTGAVVVLAVTTVACIAPALRAARTDPLGVLRAD